ncbi:MAG: hypothetical protein FWF76_02165 [Oscillospiraceae bacterium]|nr:hypothetical protein [Oscillospiraceae bacterium]
MSFFQKKSTKIISAVILAVVMVTTMLTVTADQPFITFGYDWWLDTYPNQSGYVVDRVIDAAGIRVRDGANPVSHFRTPQDLFIYENPTPGGVYVLLHEDSPINTGASATTGDTIRSTVRGEAVTLTRVEGVLVFIVDSGNNRIIVVNEEFELIRIIDELFYRTDYRVENFIGEVDEYGIPTEQGEARFRNEVERVFELDQDGRYVRGRTTTMDSPRGIYVTNFHGETRVYIADFSGGHVHGNGRVIAADLNSGIWMEYHQPESDTFVTEEGTPATFNPEKVLIDNVGNVYIIVPTISRGAVTFDENGVFRGYFGANRVAQTAEAILNYFLRLILPREVMDRRVTPPPVVFSNFAIDEDQFIYTVTTTRATGVDVVSKLNPAGDNVFADRNMTWGAFHNPIVQGRELYSQMVAIAVDEKGDIFILCQRTGQIFQYDKEGHLLFIFGGSGNQQGTFNTPVAIDTHQNSVFVLDENKATVTVFALTEFGSLVATAMELFERGDYAASRAPWEEVMRRDANFYMASIGMGNAMLSLEYFEEALEYFYRHSLGGYSRAFREFRTNYIRDNFNTFLFIALTGVAILIGANIGLKVYRKRKKALSGA